jgi:hypothetical protein
MSQMSQEEIDKLLSTTLDIAPPRIDVISSPILPVIKRRKPTSRERLILENRYIPPAREESVHAYCGCGNKIKEINILSRTSTKKGYWCDVCNINFTLSEIQSWSK